MNLFATLLVLLSVNCFAAEKAYVDIKTSLFSEEYIYHIKGKSYSATPYNEKELIAAFSDSPAAYNEVLQHRTYNRRAYWFNLTGFTAILASSFAFKKEQESEKTGTAIFGALSLFVSSYYQNKSKASLMRAINIYNGNPVDRSAQSPSNEMFVNYTIAWQF